MASTHQNVFPNAVARGWATLATTDGGAESAVDSPPASPCTWTEIWCSRTTATRAVPIEPPMRWTMLMAVGRPGHLGRGQGLVRGGDRRHHHEPEADPPDEQRHGQVGEAGVGPELGVGHRPEGGQHQSDGHDPAGAVPVGEAPGERHDQGGADALGGHQEPGGQGRLAPDDLVVDGQEEHPAEQGGAEAERGDRRRRELAVLEQDHLDERGDLGPQGVEDEGGDQGEADDDRDEHAGRRALAGLGQAVDEQAESGRQQAEPEDVELVVPVGPVVARAGTARPGRWRRCRWGCSRRRSTATRRCR